MRRLIWRRRQAMTGDTSPAGEGGSGGGVGLVGALVSFIADLLDPLCHECHDGDGCGLPWRRIPALQAAHFARQPQKNSNRVAGHSGEYGPDHLWWRPTNWPSMLENSPVSLGVAPARSVGVAAVLRYAAQLAVTGALYWVFAKFGLALASINASATPIWPPSGLALAAVLLFGYRIAPAIFIAAFLVNLATAGTVYTSLAIGAGNTLEPIVAAALIHRFCGPDVFASPVSVAKFGLICAVASTPLAATVGVGTLAIAGLAPWENFGSIWATWWLGDLGGAIVVAPPIFLWARSERASFAADEILESFALFLAAAVVGLIAFSPFAAQNVNRGALAFLTILPLMWAALRRGQRDTATAALILSGFAVWGTMAGIGPFASPVPNDAFILLLMFMISTVMPSLALASDVAARVRTEAELRRARAQLSRRVQQGAVALADAEQTIETHRAHLLEAQRLAHFGSWVWNVADGRLVWSDQLFKIYGVRPNEFKATFEDFIGRIHPDDREAVQQRIGDAMKTGRTFRLDERILRPNGEIDLSKLP